MIAEAIEAFGAIDILLNNAGTQHVAPIDQFPVEKWDLIIALNLSAAFHTIRLALPGMKAKGWGRIINTASAHSLVASPNKSAYVAAKHGIAGLTKTVALEAATSGITVNCISPGYVWTPLVENQIPDTMSSRGLTREQVINDVMLAAQPTKKFVTVDQVAGAGAVPVPRRSRLDHRRQHVDGRRLDRRLARRGVGAFAERSGRASAAPEALRKVRQPPGSTNGLGLPAAIARACAPFRNRSRARRGRAGMAGAARSRTT